ncbi:glycine zipper family protein [Campylobacter californiensis]|uniref:glycine zipper family protein n=1 Tax=Campylobacter californiensis TaxID=1032243 RepID=UPI0014735F3D|nr:glycine zipper family protein [Campylobacter sp. RM12916]MBE3610491.1 glycine zipper family protein [Campylobacter sp. RM12916]
MPLDIFNQTNKMQRLPFNDKNALLSQKDKERNEIKQGLNYVFTGGDDLLQNKIQNTADNKDMISVINDARAQHEAQIPLTQRLFGDKEQNYQKGENALKAISAELKAHGKGSLVACDDGKIYYRNTKNELIDLDEGILKDLWYSTKANKGAILAGVGGAMLAPMTGGASLGAIMAGGATGSALGSASDYATNATATNQEIDAKTMALLALENAGLSLAGDGAVYAVGKGGKALYEGGKNFINKARSATDSFGNKIDGVSLAQKVKGVVDNSPLIGDVTSSNHAPAMGDIKRNIQNAQKSMTPEEIAQEQAYLNENKIELDDVNTLGIKAKAYADDYASRTSWEPLKNRIEKAGEYIEQKAKGSLNPTITKEQEIALNHAFADTAELKTIKEVISDNDLVRNKAIDVVDELAKKRLQQVGIDENLRLNSQSLKAHEQQDLSNIKNIFESYVKAQKDEYKAVKDAFTQIKGNAPLVLDRQGLNDAIDEIVANYAKVEDRDKMRLSLEQMARDGFNVNKAFDVRKNLNKAIRNSDYSGAKQAQALKDVLDDSLFKSLGDDGRLRELLKEQDIKYAQMKNLKDTKIFNKFDDLINDDFSFESIAQLLNKNNNVWQKATQGLEAGQIAEVEKAYIRSVTRDALADLGMNKKGLDTSQVAQKLKDANFVSDEAKTLQKNFFNDERFRPNTSGIIDAVSSGLKTQKQGGTIATTLTGKLMTSVVSSQFKRMLKHIPILGKTAGKQHLYAEAFLKAKTSQEAIQNIIKHPQIPLKEKLEFFTHANTDKIRSVIDDFIRAKDENIAQLKDVEYKPNFTLLGESGKAKSDLTTKFELAPNVRNLSKLTTDEISADLEYLASKHPEMFSKPSEVFKLIREIKNEPTHFYNNNRLDYALLIKRMNKNKIGKLAIDKESGEVKHATKVDNKDLRRLKNVSDKQENEARALSKLSSRQVANQSDELGLPSIDKIISKNTLKDNIDTSDFSELELKLAKVAPTSKKILREAKDRQKTKEPNFTIGGGKLTYMDEVKFELSEVLKEKTAIDDKISTSLAWLKSRHPEMFKNKRAVKELIEYVIDEPNTIKPAKSKNGVYISRQDGNKMKDIVINKDENKIIHANQRRLNANEMKSR